MASSTSFCSTTELCMPAACIQDGRYQAHVAKHHPSHHRAFNRTRATSAQEAFRESSELPLSL